MGGSGGRYKESWGGKSRRKKRRRKKQGKGGKKRKKGKMMEVKKVAEECEIWDEKEEVAKSEAEAKKLVPEKFHR